MRCRLASEEMEGRAAPKSVCGAIRVVTRSSRAQPYREEEEAAECGVLEGSIDVVAERLLRVMRGADGEDMYEVTWDVPDGGASSKDGMNRGSGICTCSMVSDHVRLTNAYKTHRCTHGRRHMIGGPVRKVRHRRRRE